ncbi:hypothetical protein J6590_033876 [Homalodisca vitripennis]|nr:hypothetical protein J6590_033876 [Homalodisca vitripennis]
MWRRRDATDQWKRRRENRHRADVFRKISGFHLIAIDLKVWELKGEEHWGYSPSQGYQPSKCPQASLNPQIRIYKLTLIGNPLNGNVWTSGMGYQEYLIHVRLKRYKKVNDEDVQIKLFTSFRHQRHLDYSSSSVQCFLLNRSKNFDDVQIEHFASFRHQRQQDLKLAAPDYPPPPTHRAGTRGLSWLNTAIPESFPTTVGIVSSDHKQEEDTSEVRGDPVVTTDIGDDGWGPGGRPAIHFNPGAPPPARASPTELLKLG